MTPERWRKIEDIFQAALDLSGDERDEFVRRECAGDDEARRECERLIADSKTGNGFLESPIWTDSRFLQSEIKREIAASLEKEINADDRNKSSVGRRIGVYRLVKELGKGGMGEVFLAERADGEFNQKVAVKLIKRGMDTDFIVKRFRRERQIAAALNHPNIARLFDGGTTPDDLPYFVMEYVEGKPFLKYAETNNLDLRGKLELFLQVCRAIVHAHKRKIIHRDIKPSNILVSDDGEPKLLDFGIAKILDPDFIHEPVMPTQTQMRLMTPEYASPEQVRGDEVTEGSDQYSLGVLLYELITGNRPYQFSSRAPHEIARVICEELPSEPSSGALGKAITGRDDLSALTDDCCKELDRIVLKALRKNPAERYASVKDFSRDIERFLSNETVLAESFAREKKASKVGRESVKPSPAGQKSIAVLPFRILNALTDHETGEMTFLGIGLADALITRLSNVRQFVVRPTSSVLRFNQSDADSFRAGRELNVEFVLEGSILKIDSRVRVSVQLLNVAENSTVWAERFDEELTDVLTLEDVISARAADSLMPRLSTGDRLKLAKRGTDQPKAYEAYLKGRFYWNTFTEESFAKAFVAYHEAIAHDPNYALAYAGIADYYIWLGVYGVVPPKDCYPPAKNAARRAIELDDQLAEAYAALGFAELCGDYNWTEAEKNLVRAVEINPHYTVARLWYSYVLQTAGRFDEGITQARRAVELDPLTYTNRHVLAWAYYFARRFDRAVAQTAANIEKFPGIGLAYFTQSWILRFLGGHENALNASQRALELAGGSRFVLLGHAQTLAAAGRKAETEATLRRVFEQGTRQYLSYYQIALVYAYERENEKALDALERAFADREGWLIWLGVEPALDRLRSEPRFVNLRGKVDRQPINAESKAAAPPERLEKSEKSEKSGKSEASQKPNRAVSFDEAKTNSNAPAPNRAAPVALKYGLAMILLAAVVYGLYRTFF